tara:strand:+ start:2511 stop:2768 length:258 start_codon:yes stop_codon:yes gene_type:complete
MDEFEKILLVAKAIKKNPKEFFEHRDIKIDYGGCHITYYHPIDYDVKVMLNDTDRLVIMLDHELERVGHKIVLAGIVEDGEVISR